MNTNIVFSNSELQTFQVLGNIVRVHWGSEEYQYITFEDSEIESPPVGYRCFEAVVPITADRQTFINIINTAGGDGETLADQWFQGKVNRGEQ